MAEERKSKECSKPTYQPYPMMKQPMDSNMMYNQYQMQMYMQMQHQMLMQMQQQPMDYTGMMGQMDESMSYPSEEEDLHARQRQHIHGGGSGFGHVGGFGHGGNLNSFLLFYLYPQLYPNPYYPYY